MDQRLVALGIQVSDLEETFARSSGPGGQNVNKVSTSVRIRHLPSGLTVVAQDSRSQSMNRELALRRLLDLIEKRRTERKAAARHATEKRRRATRKRPRGLKERILRTKKKRGELKQLRAKIA